MSLQIIYDIGIWIYALGLLFFISDCVTRNRTAKRTGTGLLFVAALLQFAVAAMRMTEAGKVSFFTTFDFLLFCSLSITVISIVLAFMKRSEYASLLLGVIGFGVILLNRVRLAGGYNPLETWDTVKGLVTLHIALASLSLTALTVGAVFAGMYLFLHSRLKNKKWNDVIRRLPSLEMLDKYSYTALLIGTPVLVLSLGLAIYSVVTEGRWTLLADLKVLSTSIALGIYIFYFIRRRIQLRSGLETARWALIGLAFLVLNFMLNAWSEFHSWSGV